MFWIHFLNYQDCTWEGRLSKAEEMEACTEKPALKRWSSTDFQMWNYSGKAVQALLICQKCPFWLEREKNSIIKTLLLFREYNSPWESAKCKQALVNNKDSIKMQFNLNFPPSHYIPQKGVRKRKKRRLEDLLTGRENILRSH